MAGDQLVYQGVGFVEAQDRVSEHRSGVPSKGAATVLQSTTGIRRTSKVSVKNTGEEPAHLRLKRQGTTKTASLEPLTALAQPGNKYVGKLQFKSIVPGSVSIVNAGAPATIVDSLGNGVLHDTGAPTTTRGTINYVTGELALTYGAAPTEPVTITYQHRGFVDFETTNQIVTGGAGALPYTLNLPFGRVVPRSVSLTDGVSTWVDDGKGNMLQSNAKRGTIDYAKGIVVLTSGPAVAAPLTVASVMKFNPFAALVAAAAGAKLLDVYSQIPEITNGPWGLGIRGESKLGLSGESDLTGGKGTNLVVEWAHYGEEPYRVEEVFSGFPAGGFDNDPSIDHSQAHL